MPATFASRPDRLLNRSGVSLIEVTLALALLATSFLAMGGLMFQVARHQQRSMTAGYRSSAVTTVGGWAQALPWDSLDAASGCVADSVGAFTYNRCATVITFSPNLKQVIVGIISTGALAAQPETVVVNRNRPRRQSRLN